eukprot:1469667-Pleurochrysis_carterae.AAC.1
MELAFTETAPERSVRLSTMASRPSGPRHPTTSFTRRSASSRAPPQAVRALAAARRGETAPTGRARRAPACRWCAPGR